MGSIYKLIIEDDEGKTTVVPLPAGEYTIGRLEDCSIRLMERNISRHHARLVRTNGAVKLEDLSSFNGIKVNRERIESEVELQEGDLVEIGDYHLALQHAEAQDAAEPENRSFAGTLPDFQAPEPATVQATPMAAGVAATELPVSMDLPVEVDSLPPFPAELDDRRGTEQTDRAPPSRLGPAQVAEVDRLICVTTEYAGKDFALSKPEVVIGRTEDNDIVIEHRSVSRNHAKLLFDGRSHKIVDLESANGVLVNGEEYAITDLRPADLIELGHVRFRFIPAGSSFLPSAEESAAMEECGVAPPVAPERQPTLSDPLQTLRSSDGKRLDPSQARTVLDTPIDTLSEQFRQTRDEPAGNPLDVSERKSTEADNRVSHPALVSPKRQLMVIALSAVVILAALTAGIMYFGAGEGESDRALRAFYERGDFAMVQTYYLDHHDKFANPGTAQALYNDALSRMQDRAIAVLPKRKPEAPVAPPEPDPEPPPEPPVVTVLEPVVVAEVPAQPVPEGGAAVSEAPKAEPARPEAVEAPKAEVVAKVKKPRRTRPSRAQRWARAKELEGEGRRALLRGEFKKAERLLQRCLKAADFYPYCHRQLGIIYATWDDRRAIKHYKRYIALAPNAPDADVVRKQLRSVQEDL